MAKIIPTPEELRELAWEYHRQGEIMEHVFEALDNLNSVIKSEEGRYFRDRTDRYISRYSDLRPSIDSMHQLITDFASMLNRLADELDLVDKDM